MMNNFEAINSHNGIYLGNISEPEDNSLRLIVEEGEEGVEKPMDPMMREILGLPMTDEELQTSIYEIIFNSYVGYAVLDRRYVKATESTQDKLFNIYQRSHYLDYIDNHSHGGETHKDKLVHYSFHCLSHIIDVVASEAPIIKDIGKRSTTSGIQLT